LTGIERHEPEDKSVATLLKACPPRPNAINDAGGIGPPKCRKWRTGRKGSRNYFATAAVIDAITSFAILNGASLDVMPWRRAIQTKSVYSA
jgi:hypothetical protein